MGESITRPREITEAVTDWFLENRGIAETTLADFGVRQEREWLLFPYPNGEKARRDPTLEGPRQFRFTAGFTPELFGTVEAIESPTMFMVEGETDTMRLHQELGGTCSVKGLSGVNAWQPHFVSEFDKAEVVYVILDNDEDYAVRANTDKTWRQIRLDLGRKAKRVSLPPGIKDVCEFFETYDIDALRTLTTRKGNITSKLTLLDLTKEPPPMDWLVDGLICSGDVNLIVGEPSLGKSWLTMDLALAVAQGNATWLGKTLYKTGRVLYVDEENPEDIIFHRFKKLGLTEKGARNIAFAHRPGIWMNKDPDTILDEAMEIEPVLIVLDSLSQIHNEDENAAGAMASLFREAITPLARNTGAAVMVIHHTTKGDSGSGFQRARGSGGISASVDAALDVRSTTEPGKFSISQYKSRRRLGGELIFVTITDTPTGGVQLVHHGLDQLRF